MDANDFPKVTELAIPFFVAAILIELWLVRTGRAKGAFETRDTLTSLMMGTGNVVAGLLLGVVSYTALVWVWQFRFFDLGLSIWVLQPPSCSTISATISTTASRIVSAGSGPSTSTIIPASTTICRRRCVRAGPVSSPACSCCRRLWSCSAFIPQS
jgi:hypothetical protein